MEKQEIIKENIKKSKRKYGQMYNKLNIGVQLNRELIHNLRNKIGDQVSVKSYIEDLIKKQL